MGNGSDSCPWHRGHKYGLFWYLNLFVGFLLMFLVDKWEGRRKRASFLLGHVE